MSWQKVEVRTSLGKMHQTKDRPSCFRLTGRNSASRMFFRRRASQGRDPELRHRGAAHDDGAGLPEEPHHVAVLEGASRLGTGFGTPLVGGPAERKKTFFLDVLGGWTS